MDIYTNSTKTKVPRTERRFSCIYAEYFDGEEEDDESLVRNKSDFTPSKNRNTALEKFIN